MKYTSAANESQLRVDNQRGALCSKNVHIPQRGFFKKSAPKAVSSRGLLQFLPGRTIQEMQLQKNREKTVTQRSPFLFQDDKASVFSGGFLLKSISDIRSRISDLRTRCAQPRGICAQIRNPRSYIRNYSRTFF